MSLETEISLIVFIISSMAGAVFLGMTIVSIVNYFGNVWIGKGKT